MLKHKKSLSSTLIPQVSSFGDLLLLPALTLDKIQAVFVVVVSFRRRRRPGLTINRDQERTNTHFFTHSTTYFPQCMQPTPTYDTHTYTYL